MELITRDPTSDPTTGHRTAGPVDPTPTDPDPSTGAPVDTEAVGMPAVGPPFSGQAPPTAAAPPPPESPPPPFPPPPPPPPGPGGPSGGWQTPPPPPGERRHLRRSVRNRMLGGVAAGLAEYLDVDVLLVRIAMVVLAVLGGSGVLLYLAAWLLIPAEDTGRAVVQDYIERRPRRRSILALVIGAVIAIVAVSNLFSSGPWWRHWDGGFGGFGFFFGLCALALGVALLISSGRREGSPVRWLLVTTLVALVGIVMVAAATVFSVEALSGVPLRGGIGDTQWRPTSVSQVAPDYRQAIGTMEVDLRNVTFGPGTTHVTATVGIGRLVVYVPTGTTVSVTAHSGLGAVQVFGQDQGGFATRQTVVVPAGGSGAPAPPATPGTAGTAVAAGVPRLVIDAETGVGRVEVVRS
ncbi:MAG TPA: PspC domain-containing protein [Acidimicrobiales bacterium]|nr:PspC domain-containing protein [Acidimicrobiales bacterium]